MDCSQLQKSLSHLLSLLAEFTSVYTRVEESKGHKDPANKQAIESSESLLQEIRLAIREIENYFYVSLRQAQEIMDREGQQNFLGSEQVKIAFGIEVKDIPKIPFSREELERARELGQMLILRMDKCPDGQPLTMEKINQILQGRTKDGQKILNDYDETEKKMNSDCWYKDEDFFTKESPQFGWALVSKEVIPDSTDSNYLIQSEKLIDYLINQVFKGQEIPQIYQQALQEFEKVRQQEKLDELITQDLQKAAQILEELQITQLLRQSPAETFYDLMIYFQNTGQRLLENIYTWSNRRHSSGRLVFVGGFDADGAYADKDWSKFSDSELGVCFSRRF